MPKIGYTIRYTLDNSHIYIYIYIYIPVNLLTYIYNIFITNPVGIPINPYIYIYIDTQWIQPTMATQA